MVSTESTESTENVATSVQLRFAPETPEDERPVGIEPWQRWILSPAGILRQVFRVCAVICMIALALTVLAGVVARYLLDSPLYWSDALSTTFLVWLTFFVVGPAMHDRQLPSIHVSLKWMPAPMQRYWLLLRELLTLVLALLLADSGWRFATAVMHTDVINLPISEGVIYISFFVGCVATVIELVARLARRAGTWWEFVLCLAGSAAVAFGLTHAMPITGNSALVVMLTMLALLVLGVPLWIALTGAVMLGVVLGTSLPFEIVAEHSAVGVIKNVLLAIALYMLTGVLMQITGLAARLVDFAESVVGWMRGGLGLTDILASTIFADMSCSANADAAAVGRVMIPQMVRRGYDPANAAAIQSSAASLGMLIPPHTSLILYSSVTLVSVGTLFAAAILPAIGVTLTLFLVVYLTNRRHRTGGHRFSPTYIGSSFVKALPALFTIVVILGGVLGGVVTAPESGVLAVVYTMVIATVLRAWPEKPLRAIWTCLYEAGAQTGRVTSIIAGATALGWLLTLEGLPVKVVDFLAQFCDTPLKGLIAINVIFIIFHLFMDAGPAILVVTPIILPLAIDLHIDLIQLAMVICLNSGIGMVLPPVGLLSYITAGIANVPVQRVFKAVLPYTAVLLVDLALMTVFPVLTVH